MYSGGFTIPEAARGSTFGDVFPGISNFWYNFTGQSEKTSAYKALVAREDQMRANAYQTAAADMEAAGLSKYGLTSGASGSSSVHQGSETKGLQLMAGLVDLMRSKAEIGNLNAQADKATAEAESTRTSTSFISDVVGSQIAESQARTALIKSQTEQVAENILASVQGRTIAEAEHIKKMEWFDFREVAEIGEIKNRASLMNNQAYTERKRWELIDMQVKESAEKIAKSESERYHLSQEDALLVQDLAYKELMTEIASYDYNYSIEHGLRYSDSSSKFFGVNMDALGQGVFDIGDTIFSGIKDMVKSLGINL